LNRIRLQRNKKTNLNDMMRREAAVFLTDGKEPSAVVKVENIIREERLIEVYNLLEIHIEHLLIRIDSIPLSTIGPPPDVLEPLATTIYASPRISIKELKQINNNWVLKYGNAFVSDAMSNRRGVVNEQVLEKLSFYKPSKNLIYKILISIAKQYLVNWNPPDDYIEEEVKSGLEPSEEQLLSELESYSKSTVLKKSKVGNKSKDNVPKEEPKEEPNEEPIDEEEVDLSDLSDLPSFSGTSKTPQSGTSSTFISTQNKTPTQTKTFSKSTNNINRNVPDVPDVPEFGGFDDEDFEFPDVPISYSTPPPTLTDSGDLDLPDVPSPNSNIDLDLPEIPMIHSQIVVHKKDMSDKSINIPKETGTPPPKNVETNNKSVPNFDELTQRLNRLKK